MLASIDGFEVSPVVGEAIAGWLADGDAVAAWFGAGDGSGSRITAENTIAIATMAPVTNPTTTVERGPIGRAYQYERVRAEGRKRC